MRAVALFPLILPGLLAASCGDFFYDGDGQSHHHGRGRRFGPGNDCMQGEDAGASARPDARVRLTDSGAPPPADSGVVEADAGVLPEMDAGAMDAAGPSCATSADCPVGSTCVASSCEPCPEGVCTCMRDDECPADQICNHPIATCEDPPVLCSDLTVEADCLARTDCQAIYSGMNCRDSQGGDCESGDPNCTCETFSFAVCIDKE